MKWSHLPVAGGLYDQDPRFLDAMAVIFAKRGEYEREKAKRDEAKSIRAAKPARVAGRRH